MPQIIIFIDSCIHIENINKGNKKNPFLEGGSLWQEREGVRMKETGTRRFNCICKVFFKLIEVYTGVLLHFCLYSVF